MARSAGRGYRRPGRKIDFKQWDFIPAIELTTTVSGTFSGGGLAFTIPATILRARSRIIAFFDATVQVADTIDVGLGLAVISSDAFTLGATAFPDPLSEPEYPWLWWTDISLRAEETGAATNRAWGTASQLLSVDTKAMRKIKPQETLCWVMQTSNVVGAPTTRVDIQRTRVLIGT